MLLSWRRLEITKKIKLEWLVILHIRSDIKNISCYTSDSVPVILNGKLFYRVTDPELACFSIKNYHSGVVATGESSIRSVIGKLQS